jgi:hypothetical protein
VRLDYPDTPSEKVWFPKIQKFLGWI